MLHTINQLYLKQMLRLAHVPHEALGQLYLISGHEDYNNLLRVNALFSTNPCWWPVDRTQSTRSSLRLTVYRPWQPPIKQLALVDSLAQRVQELCASGKMCNILWSGGIDSTTVLTAFLLFAPDFTQVRVLYSPWSTYEHPDYVPWLQAQYPRLEMLDISGTSYLDHQFDGLFITGEGGDESMASLDQTFYSATGHDTLHQPWQDYFHRKLGASGNNLIDFFQAYCALAGRPIETLLEARWWFYIACKTDSLLREGKIELLVSETTPIDPTRLIGFFDCDQFLSFIYHNLEQIIADQGYANWKKCFKKSVLITMDSRTGIKTRSSSTAINWPGITERKLS